MPDARVPTEAELDWITRRAVAEIIPYDEFVKALKSGRSLRLKMGFDPSAPDLTLGHAVGLRKLRQLQDLGHRVVIIVGDWTARIGDPSGVSKTRPMLTEEQVTANAETYLKQFFRIVDREMTEVRWQSEWFNDFTLTNVVRLAAKFTVAQMLERADFAERFATQKPISIHELLYPLLQAYDSVAVKADVEFGGTDQKFNLMVGRELQPDFEQKPQIVYTVPLLVGTDGEMKMSKSLGNYVGVADPPNEMFGKLMGLKRDDLIGDYLELLTNVPDEEMAAIRESIEKRTVNPMESKRRMAREVVAEFYSVDAASEADSAFTETYRTRTVSSSFDAILVPEGTKDVSVTFDGRQDAVVSMPDLLKRAGVVSSASEARRLIDQGAVEILGNVHGSTELFARHKPKAIKSVRAAVSPGMLIRVGKHRFVRIVETDQR
jgi:tyrosyl-tRNA synthetase